MSCQQKKRIFFVLNTPPVRNRTFFSTQFKPYRFLRHLKCWFCDRGLRNEQFQVFWLKSLDVYFFVVSPLICSSFLSSGGVLRAWKRVKVGFLRQGSSKLASPISYIFPLGSLQRGRGDFFRDQDLTQKASPDVPRRLKTCIFTYKTRSQTLRTRVFTYKTRSHSVPDAPSWSQTAQNTYFH